MQINRDSHCWWKCKMLTATSEDSLLVSYKVRHKFIIQPNSHAPGYLPKWTENFCSCKKLYRHLSYQLLRKESWTFHITMYLSISVVSFRSMYPEALLLHAFTLNIVIPSWWIDPLVIFKCPSLSLITYFILVYFEINIASLGFFY